MARGSIVKRPSGNYAIVYYVDGKQKWETIGPSRREAERALTARKREVDTGAWREPSAETLREYATRWLDRRNPSGASGGRTRLAPSTYAGYCVNLRLHVLQRLGERTLASLRTEDVDELIAALEAEGKAPATVRNVVVPLRKMLADAVRQGLIVANPAARADLPPAQDFAGKEIPLAHTNAIRAALVELAPTDPLRNEPDLFYVHFFDVALGTGLRRGELLALRFGRSSPRSTWRFVLSLRERSSGGTTRLGSSFSRLHAARRSTRRTSTAVSGNQLSKVPASRTRDTASMTCATPASRAWSLRART